VKPAFFLGQFFQRTPPAFFFFLGGLRCNQSTMLTRPLQNTVRRSIYKPNSNTTYSRSSTISSQNPDSRLSISTSQSASNSAAATTTPVSVTPTFVLLLLLVLVVLVIVQYFSSIVTTSRLHITDTHSTQISDEYLALIRHQNAAELDRFEHSAFARSLCTRADLILGADMIPTVIYVHRRQSDLQQVIDSLAQAQESSKSIVVISHDGAYTDMYSCSRRAAISGHFGHVLILTHPFVTARGEHHLGSRIRLKQHWFWLTGFIADWMTSFNQKCRSGTTAAAAESGASTATVTAAGMAMYLEEDTIVAPDFFLVTQRMHSAMQELQSPQLYWGFSPLVSRAADAFLRPKLPAAAVAVEPVTTLNALTLRTQLGLVSYAHSIKSSVIHALHHNDTIRDAFFNCRDGWDVSFSSLQHRKLLPLRFLDTDQHSFVKNIGSDGLHMYSDLYKSSGLGRVTLPSRSIISDDTSLSINPLDPRTPHPSFVGMC
jgi:hypothetical protein